MKHITIGENTLYFSILRDLPYWQPTTNYYGVTVRSMDLDSEKTFLVRDVSTSPESYQHFLCTGTTGTESLSEGVVAMIPYGMWYASVYGASGSTLSDVDTSEVLWKGIIYSKEA